MPLRRTDGSPCSGSGAVTALAASISPPPGSTRRWYPPQGPVRQAHRHRRRPRQPAPAQLHPERSPAVRPGRPRRPVQPWPVRRQDLEGQRHPQRHSVTERDEGLLSGAETRRHVRDRCRRRQQARRRAVLRHRHLRAAGPHPARSARSPGGQADGEGPGGKLRQVANISGYELRQRHRQRGSGQQPVRLARSEEPGPRRRCGR